jgi:hypothetical protein
MASSGRRSPAHLIRRAAASVPERFSRDVGSRRGDDLVSDITKGGVQAL